MTFSHLRGGPNGWEVFARNSNPMFFSNRETKRPGKRTTQTPESSSVLYHFEEDIFC